MVALTILSIGIFIMIAYLYATAINKRRGRREEIRIGWGAPQKLTTNFNRIARYAAIAQEGVGHKLSQQTEFANFPIEIIHEARALSSASYKRSSLP